MPNWCSNCLKVCGSKENLQAFTDTCTDNEITLETHVPMPEILNGTEVCFGGPEPTEQQKLDTEERVKQTGSADWYSWSLSNWGTKWNIDPSTLEIGEDVTAHFDTAWSPPTSWLQSVSKLFPELTFTLYFSEGGMGFYGYCSVEGGEILEDVTYHDFFKPREDRVESDEEECDYTTSLTDACKEFLNEHGLGIGG